MPKYQNYTKHNNGKLNEGLEPIGFSVLFPFKVIKLIIFKVL